MKTNNQKTNRFQSLPSFVLDNIYEDYTLEAITRIRKEYLESNLDKNEILKGIIRYTVLKDIKIEQLAEAIEEGLKLDNKQSIEVALIILCEILYPINSYFPGIEDEILKLGGEIPKEKLKQLTEQLLKREEAMEKMKEAEEAEERKRMADTIVSKSIKNLIDKYPVVEKQQIGSQESIKLKSMSAPMKPLIKYWLKDYREKMGHYRHSNIERARYVYHDKNTKSMNEEERRQLNLILKSVDEKILLPYSTKNKKIDFSKTVD
ncbi:MAG: hypothetical protein U9P70_02760 [Patescibacteria group bacterium]|nr:hypothetical protein [Patescibacteria group bacterium]